MGSANSASSVLGREDDVALLGSTGFALRFWHWMGDEGREGEDDEGMRPVVVLSLLVDSSFLYA